VDVSRRAIAGVVLGGANGGSPYFVLARPENANDLFLKKLAQAAKATTSRGGGIGNRIGIRSPFRHRPGRQELVGWAQRFVDEYPEVDAYQTVQGTLFGMARNLFRDEHFKEYFGKTYEEMGRGERDDLASAIRKIKPPRANFPEERPAGVLRAVEGGFGKAAAPDITLSILAFRIMRGWRDASIHRLHELEPVSGTLGVVAAIETAEDATLAQSWPSERAAFANEIANARTKLAAPILVAQVEELIASAEGLSGAKRLAASLQAMAADSPRRRPAPGNRRARDVTRAAAVPQGSTFSDTLRDAYTGATIPELMLVVSPDVRSDQRTRIQRRMEELLQREVQQDQLDMVGLGAGIDGVRNGVLWYAAVTQKYGALAGEPPVEGLLGEFARRRGEILPGVESTLSARIEAVGSVGEVTNLVNSYLSVPSDRSDRVGDRLLKAAQRQAERFTEAEREQAREDAAAAREAASACAQAPDTPGEYQGEPTAQEICRAVEATLSQAQENLKGLSSSCSGVRDNDPMGALACLLGSASQVGGGPQLSLRTFAKVACVPAKNRPGFYCDYSVDLQSDNNYTKSTFDLLGSEIITRRFVHSNGEWLIVVDN